MRGNLVALEGGCREGVLRSRLDAAQGLNVMRGQPRSRQGETKRGASNFQPIVGDAQPRPERR
eukprot:2233168-Rhodomonas_salina.1